MARSASVNRQNLFIKTIACRFTCRGLVCAHFATPFRKRVVTKSHKPSLNCLLPPKRQLSEQELGTSDSSRSDTSVDEAISKKTTALGWFSVSYDEGTHEIEHQGILGGGGRGRFRFLAGKRL